MPAWSCQILGAFLRADNGTLDRREALWACIRRCACTGMIMRKQFVCSAGLPKPSTGGFWKSERGLSERLSSGN